MPKGIETLKRLKFLSLTASDSLLDINPLSELENLEILDLSWMYTKFSLQPLNNLLNLKEIKVWVTKDLNLEPISDLILRGCKLVKGESTTWENIIYPKLNWHIEVHNDHADGYLERMEEINK